MKELIERLEKAADPFIHLRAVMEEIPGGKGPRGDDALRDFTPGTWPTWQDLVSLTDAVSALKSRTGGSHG